MIEEEIEGAYNRDIDLENIPPIVQEDNDQKIGLFAIYYYVMLIINVATMVVYAIFMVQNISTGIIILMFGQIVSKICFCYISLYRILFLTFFNLKKETYFVYIYIVSLLAVFADTIYFFTYPEYKTEGIKIFLITNCYVFNASFSFIDVYLSLYYKKEPVEGEL